jgi:hypothetical protein
MPTALFDAVLLLHVATALVAFGSIAVSSTMARRGHSVLDPAAEEGLVRYFGSGPSGDWPARMVFLVPLFGMALLGGQAGHHGYAGKVWPWIGLGLWVVAVGAITGRLWPAERDARAALAGAIDESGGLDAVAAFRSACRRMENAATIATFSAVVAIVVMIWQPG